MTVAKIIMVSVTKQDFVGREITQNYASPVNAVKAILDNLEERERLEAIDDVCPGCGSHKPCHCMNDE